MRNARALTAFFLAALLAAGLTGALTRKLLAQDNGNASVGVPGKDDLIGSATTHIVMTPVTVTDRGGNVVNNLTPKDFRLTDNGKVQVITEDVAVLSLIHI